MCRECGYLECEPECTIGRLEEELTALRAEVEALRADARLGRMVRAMPEFAYLRRDEQRWCVSYHDKPNAYADTPEEALVAAGCGEVEE